MPSNKEVNAAIRAYILEKHTLTSSYQKADAKGREEIIKMYSNKRSTKTGMIKALEAAEAVRYGNHITPAKLEGLLDFIENEPELDIDGWTNVAEYCAENGIPYKGTTNNYDPCTQPPKGE